MANNEEIQFDPNCGISEEEQREIFTQINGIAEKNRQALAAVADDEDTHRKKRHPAPHFKAKKSGGLFPILVNAAAILVLVGGFLVLSGFQGKTDAQVREGTRIYNTAERALIQEIRKDTSVSEQGDFARSEMERLSREQAQTATIEAQMGAFFSNLNTRINANQFDEAAGIIQSMRSFLDTPSFQNLRSMQTRKEIYTQAINSCEKMLDEARRNPAAIPTDNSDSEQLLASLQKEKDQLEKDIAEKDKSINALKKDNSAAERISELESSLSTVRSLNTTLEANSNERREQVRTLEAANATLERTVASNATTINRIKQVVQVEKSIDDMTFNEIKESLIKIQDALGN